MKTTLALTLFSLLAACSPSQPTPAKAPVEVCTGTLERVHERHYRMNCVGGEVINYTSYKYPISVNGK